MSKLPDASDLMKNLNPHEKRRLMRHVDQGSPKKSTTPVTNASKNYHVTPRPFNGGVAKPAQPSKAFTRWGSNSPTPSAGKSNSPNSVIKPVRAPNGKSKEDNVVMPQLNQAHVKLFTAQEAANNPKLKEALRKPATPQGNVNKMNAKVSPEKPNSASSANPFQKQSNVFTKQQNQPKKQPAQSVPSQPKKTSSTPKVSPPVVKSEPVKSSTSTKSPKPGTPSSVVAGRISSANNSPSQNSPKPQLVSKPTSAEPPVAWQQRAEPLSKDKAPTKASPPTAVVAPMRDRSKVVSASPGENRVNTAEAARQRSVSSPVGPRKPQTNVVSYSSSNDDVVLPDLSVNTNSALSNESKMKRSLSEASKAVQAKEAAHKNLKLGHNFEAHELKEWVNWCDACGSVILSLFGKCVSCTKCNMVCHGKCALAVSLTCKADQQLRSLTLTETKLNFYKTIVQETKDESTLKEYNTIHRVMSMEEVQDRIEEFNRTVKGSQQMTLQEDGKTFRGFIRVSMNLTRPVSVHDSSKTTRKPMSRKASFYIDKGALKALHLTSDTTSEEVVQALLLKYSISDNPMKFALFEKQVREEGHVILRKMLPRERPLFLRLLWGNGNSDKRGFILQENESRDIHWESFSIAELQMFIKILDKEENDYTLEIKKKYKFKSQDIRNAIEHQNKKAAS